MAALTEEQKLFAVLNLATFHSLTEVQALLKEVYGLEASLQQIQRYDPDTAAGRKLGQKFKVEFERARDKFIEDMSSIAIAHRSYRLREIGRLYEANRKGSRKLSADLLVQAAREAGGMYERRDEPSDLDGQIAALMEKLASRPQEEA